MTKGAILIGILLILVGIWGGVKIVQSNTPYLVLIYPIIAVALGIAMIVLNKEEEKIEERKDMKKK